MKFYAMRTDRENQDLVLEELRQGRLRQGWGYAPDQDLRLVQSRKQEGTPLSTEQKEAWGNRRMLGGDDGFSPSDTILLLPNLPKVSQFILVEVNGEYDYQPIRLSKGRQDYGHILPVTLPPSGLTGFAYRDPRVLAPLRRSLTCRSRIWSLADHAENIRGLLDLTRGGDIQHIQLDLTEAFKQTYGRAFGVVRLALQEAFQKELERAFTSADFEAPCEILLRTIFPFATVERTGGAGEHGADIVVTWKDSLIPNPDGEVSPLSWRLVVQVKDWDRTAADLKPIDQIRTAKQYYEDEPESIVKAGLIITRCDHESSAFSEHRESTAKDLNIPIRFIGKKELLDLFCQYPPEGFGFTS